MLLLNGIKEHMIDSGVQQFGMLFSHTSRASPRFASILHEEALPRPNAPRYNGYRRRILYEAQPRCALNMLRSYSEGTSKTARKHLFSTLA